MQVPVRLMTVEEFWRDYEGQDFELVSGKVVEMISSGYAASAISIRIATELNLYLRQNPIGYLTGSDGTYRLSDYDTRVPDVGFFGLAKAAQVTETGKFLPFPPDLAVEVVSPSDRASEVLDKVDLYLQSGTQMVWVVYPESRKVVVHTADSVRRSLTEDDILDGGDVLPDFQLPVKKYFR